MRNGYDNPFSRNGKIFKLNGFLSSANPTLKRKIIEIQFLITSESILNDQITLIR